MTRNQLSSLMFQSEAQLQFLNQAHFGDINDILTPARQFTAIYMDMLNHQRSNIGATARSIADQEVRDELLQFEAMLNNMTSHFSDLEQNIQQLLSTQQTTRDDQIGFVRTLLENEFRQQTQALNDYISRSPILRQIFLDGQLNELANARSLGNNFVQSMRQLMDELNQRANNFVNTVQTDIRTRYIRTAVNNQFANANVTRQKVFESLEELFTWMFGAYTDEQRRHAINIINLFDNPNLFSSNEDVQRAQVSDIQSVIKRSPDDIYEALNQLVEINRILTGTRNFRRFIINTQDRTAQNVFDNNNLLTQDILQELAQHIQTFRTKGLGISTTPDEQLQVLNRMSPEQLNGIVGFYRQISGAYQQAIGFTANDIRAFLQREFIGEAQEPLHDMTVTAIGMTQKAVTGIAVDQTAQPVSFNLEFLRLIRSQGLVSQLMDEILGNRIGIDNFENPEFIANITQNVINMLGPMFTDIPQQQQENRYVRDFIAMTFAVLQDRIYDLQLYDPNTLEIQLSKEQLARMFNDVVRYTFENYFEVNQPKSIITRHARQLAEQLESGNVQREQVEQLFNELRAGYSYVARIQSILGMGSYNPEMQNQDLYAAMKRAHQAQKVRYTRFILTRSNRLPMQLQQAIQNAGGIPQQLLEAGVLLTEQGQIVDMNNLVLGQNQTLYWTGDRQQLMDYLEGQNVQVFTRGRRIVVAQTSIVHENLENISDRMRQIFIEDYMFQTLEDWVRQQLPGRTLAAQQSRQQVINNINEILNTELGMQTVDLFTAQYVRQFNEQVEFGYVTPDGLTAVPFADHYIRTRMYEYILTNSEGLRAMAVESNKTVDKSNTNIIYTLLETVFMQGVNKPDQAEQLRTALYRPIQSQQLNQFNQQAIQQAMRRIAGDAQRLQAAGFSPYVFPQIQQVLQIPEGDQQQANQWFSDIVRTIRTSERDITQFYTSLMSSVYDEYRSIFSNKNIPESIKKLVQQSQINRYFNINAIIGPGVTDMMFKTLIPPIILDQFQFESYRQNLINMAADELTLMMRPIFHNLDQGNIDAKQAALLVNRFKNAVINTFGRKFSLKKNQIKRLRRSLRNNFRNLNVSYQQASVLRDIFDELEDELEPEFMIRPNVLGQYVTNITEQMRNELDVFEQQQQNAQNSVIDRQLRLRENGVYLADLLTHMAGSISYYVLNKLPIELQREALGMYSNIIRNVQSGNVDWLNEHQQEITDMFNRINQALAQNGAQNNMFATYFTNFQTFVNAALQMHTGRSGVQSVVNNYLNLREFATAAVNTLNTVRAQNKQARLGDVLAQPEFILDFIANRLQTHSAIPTYRTVTGNTIQFNNRYVDFQGIQEMFARSMLDSDTFMREYNDTTRQLISSAIAGLEFVERRYKDNMFTTVFRLPEQLRQLDEQRIFDILTPLNDEDSQLRDVLTSHLTDVITAGTTFSASGAKRRLITLRIADRVVSEILPNIDNEQVRDNIVDNLRTQLNSPVTSNEFETQLSNIMQQLNNLYSVIRQSDRNAAVLKPIRNVVSDIRKQVQGEQFIERLRSRTQRQVFSYDAYPQLNEHARLTPRVVRKIQRAQHLLNESMLFGTFTERDPFVTRRVVNTIETDTVRRFQTQLVDTVIERAGSTSQLAQQTFNMLDQFQNLQNTLDNMLSDQKLRQANMQVTNWSRYVYDKLSSDVIHQTNINHLDWHRMLRGFQKEAVTANDQGEMFKQQTSRLLTLERRIGLNLPFMVEQDIFPYPVSDVFRLFNVEDFIDQRRQAEAVRDYVAKAVEQLSNSGNINMNDIDDELASRLNEIGHYDIAVKRGQATVFITPGQYQMIGSRTDQSLIVFHSLRGGFFATEDELETIQQLVSSNPKTYAGKMMYDILNNKDMISRFFYTPDEFLGVPTAAYPDVGEQQFKSEFVGQVSKQIVVGSKRFERVTPDMDQAQRAFIYLRQLALQQRGQLSETAENILKNQITARILSRQMTYSRGNVRTIDELAEYVYMQLRNTFNEQQQQNQALTPNVMQYGYRTLSGEFIEFVPSFGRNPADPDDTQQRRQLARIMRELFGELQQQQSRVRHQQSVSGKYVSVSEFADELVGFEQFAVPLRTRRGSTIFVRAQIAGQSNVDRLSIASVNDVGSVMGLRSFGHSSTPIQEVYSQLSIASEKIRSITSYFAMQSSLVLDSNKMNIAGQQQRTFFNINQHPELVQLSIDLQDRMLNDMLQRGNNQQEMPGMYGIVAVVSKSTDVFARLFGEPLSLEGDAYFVHRGIRDMINIPVRTGINTVEFQTPETQMKIIDANRQKGMVTHWFDENIYARTFINGKEVLIPITAIMNMQGKRVNKTAEFGQGAARLIMFLNNLYTPEHGMQAIGIQDIQEFVVSTIRGSGVDNQTAQQMQELLINQGYLRVSDIRDMSAFQEAAMRFFLNQKWELGVLDKTQSGRPVFRTIAQDVQLQLNKMYVYQAKSHDQEITQISFVETQTMSQISEYGLWPLVHMILREGKTPMQRYNAQVQYNVSAAFLPEAAQYATLAEYDERFAKFYRRGTRAGRRGGRSSKHPFMEDAFRQRIRTLSSFFGTQANDTVDQLQEYSQAMRRLARETGDTQFINTQEFFDVLANVIQRGQYTQNALGARMLRITGEEAIRLAEFAGRDIYVPLVQTTLAQATFKDKYKPQVARQFFRYMYMQLNQDQIRTFEVKDTKLYFQKMKQPTLFKFTSSGDIGLDFSIETLTNLQQGQVSLINRISDAKQLRFRSLTQFASKRTASLYNQLTNQLIKFQSTQAGQQFYQSHSTAIQQLPGLGVPRKLVDRLLQSGMAFIRSKDEQLYEQLVNELAQRLGQQEAQRILRTRGQREDIFETFMKEQVVLDVDETNTPTVFVHQNYRNYTNAQDIERMVFKSFPFQFDIVNQLQGHVQFLDDTQMQYRYMQRLISVYQGIHTRTQWLKQFGRSIPEDQRVRIGASELYTQYGGKTGHEALQMFAREFGEAWGLYMRHPLNGYITNIRMFMFSENDMFITPLQVQGWTGGDDDGDMVMWMLTMLVSPELFRQGLSASYVGYYSPTAGSEVVMSMKNTIGHRSLDRLVRYQLSNPLYTPQTDPMSRLAKFLSDIAPNQQLDRIFSGQTTFQSYELQYNYLRQYGYSMYTMFDDNNTDELSGFLFRL